MRIGLKQTLPITPLRFRIRPFSQQRAALNRSGNVFSAWHPRQRETQGVPRVRPGRDEPGQAVPFQGRGYLG